MVKKTYKQKCSSNVIMDRARKAKAVGCRTVSKEKRKGKRYFERRKNRSDAKGSRV